MRFNRNVMLGAMGAAVLGCAGVPKPTDQVAQSEGAMRSARELGAEQVPPAALELQLAKEELAKASALMKDDKNEEATQMANRARADAELAIALTRQHQANADARSAEEQLRAVQDNGQNKVQ
jgi:hypothetical protein